MTEQDSPIVLVAAAIRHERTRARLSLSELAKRAGVAKSTLSQLESGTGNPSVETLWALATALGVPFSRLVDPPRSAIRVIRAGEGTVIRSEQANYEATLLAPGSGRERRDLYLIRAEPGEPRRSDPHPAGTVEHVVIAYGRAELGPVDDPVELGPGDYICYPADAPHIFRALEPHTAAVFVNEQR